MAPEARSDSVMVFTLHRAFIGFLLIFLVASFVLLYVSTQIGDSPVLIVSDGKAYYAWARSLTYDGDVRFENDYRLLYPPDPLPREYGQKTPSGNVVNKYPVGLAILETPGLLLGHVVPGFSSSFATDGVSLPYQISVTYSLVALCVCSLYLLSKAMINLGVRPGWAILLCTMMILATNLAHYIAKEPAMAHGAGLAIFNVIVFLLTWRPGERKELTLRGRLLIGVLVGLLLIIRNSNVFLLPLIVYLFFRRSPRVRTAAPLAIAALGVCCIQLLSLHALWGDWRLTTYPREGFAVGISGIVGTLCSARHGLLVYHPWYAVLLFLNGLGLFVRGEVRKFSALALGQFLILLVINGMWWAWWFGDSFGNRAFIESLGPLSLGAGIFLSQVRRRPRTLAPFFAVIAALVLLNLHLWAGYLFQRYPHDGQHTIGDAYLWPVRSTAKANSLSDHHQLR